MKKLRLILIIVASVFAAYTAFGFLILPVIVDSLLTKKLGGTLRRQVLVKEVKVNPFKLTFDINGFSVREKDGKDVFFSMEGLHVNLSSMSLFKLGVVIEELTLKGPYVRIEHLADGTFNFSDLAPPDEKKDEEKQPAKPFRFSIANIRLTGGRVEFLERSKEKVHKLEDISFALPFISSFPYHSKIKVTPLFTAILDGAAIGMKGGSLPFFETRETLLDIDLEALDITRYMAYAPLGTAFKVAKALLDIKAALFYEAGVDQGRRVTAKGQLTLRELKVLDSVGDPLFSLPSLDVKIAESDITGGSLHVESILLRSPSLSIIREKDGGLNLTRLFPPQSPAQEGQASTGKKQDSNKEPPRFVVDSIRIEDGAASFKDNSVAGGFETKISALAFSLSDYSNKAGSKSPLELSLRTDKGTEISTKGEVCLDPFQVNGRISLGPVRPADYEPYYSKGLLFEIISGALRMEGDYELKRSEKNPDITLSGLGLEIRDVSLKKKGEEQPFFESSYLGLEGGLLELASRRIAAESLSLKGGHLRLKRDKDGEVNISRLTEDSGTRREDDRAKQGDAWTFTLKKALIEGYGIDFEDLSTPSAVKVPVRDLRMEAENISSAEEAKAALAISLTLEQKAKFSAKGGFSINPLTADLAVDLAGLQIGGFQGYWLPHLRLAAPKGTLYVKGSMGLRREKGEGLSWRLRMDAGMRGISFLEMEKAQELMSWKTLEIKKAEVSSPPLSVSVGTVSLAEPFFRISVERDGGINLTKLVQKAGKEEEKEDNSGPGPRIKLGSFEIKKGRVVFRDESVSPTYSTVLGDISLGLKGLTTEGFKAADLSLKGNLDGYAPLDVKGRLNPLAEDIFADLKISFRGIPLSPLTPYSGKYIGYAVEKGNLSLDLKYLIDKKRLEAANKVVLDQFTLGQTIPSPQATSLPVALAVALLKNRNGVIELDLPVTGRLDDPQFSIGGIIVQMIVNILAKAVTSPFALLGAVFGAGEELSHFDFRPGSSLVEEGATGGLDKLIEALAERPELRLEILGFVDEKKDTEALKQIRLLNDLKAYKMRQMTKKGTPVPPLDKLDVDEKERAEYIARLFKEEAAKGSKGERPGDITTERMERELLDKIAISPDELRLLAIERTNAVKSYILGSGKIQPERIFVVEPRTLSPEKKEGMVESRVDFKLK